MALRTSPLGTFAKLPYELRLIIWGYIFCLELHGPLKKENLSILRTSQALHNEITNFNYNTVDIYITPEFHKGTSVFLRRSREPRSLVSYQDYKFKTVPFDKVNVAIHLDAPDPADPGQLLLMYTKGKMLVSSMNSIAYPCPFRHISIQYHQYHGIDWHCDSTPNESVKYQGRRWLDREIAFIPFLKLKNVKGLTVLPSNRRMERAVHRGFINYGSDFIIRNGELEGNASIYKDEPAYATSSPMFNDINHMIADIEFFFDTKLDHLPGCTSDMLRLCRWAEWFKDGTDIYSPYGNCFLYSPYSNWFLYVLRFYPECARKHDYGLSKFLNRFAIMVMTSTSIMGRGPKPYGNWDHQIFYKTKRFTHGYPPLSQPDLVEKGLLVSIWDRYIPPERLLPSFSRLYVAAMGWRFVQWRKKFRLPTLEFCDWVLPYYWCDDCIRAGFQFWCQNCEDLSLEVIQERGLQMRR